jgi:putative nucleotidyltransferase with HDIG domain
MALIALMFSVAASQSVVRPIMTLVSHLRKSERTGTLTEFAQELSPIQEVRELTLSFNRAAASTREAREKLQGAYVEFVGSLASALDARDTYTAGHSQRVSSLACRTAAALGASPEELETIRVGALLHDIGKIGISDLVLQKPGKLTNEEFARIREHPEIGRRILEGVHGFAEHLGAVEFHHENWDGSGYPRGQTGEETPLAARVIHVADAYDAMTSDRPYRRGMSNEQALAHILRNAGSQFDPTVARVFAELLQPEGGATEKPAAMECVWN